MKLKCLTIRATESWESKGPGYTGALTTASPTTEVQIKLSDASCREILRIAGVGIKEAAAETAQFLVSEAALVATGQLLEVSND